MEGLGRLIMRALKGGKLGHFLVPTRRIPVCIHGSSCPSLQPEVLHMTHSEEAIIERLRSGGPCGLDDVVTALPNFSWGELFVAVDCMSRDGRVSLLQIGYSTYQISLGSRFAYSSSTS